VPLINIAATNIFAMRAPKLKRVPFIKSEFKVVMVANEYWLLFVGYKLFGLYFSVCAFVMLPVYLKLYSCCPFSTPRFHYAKVAARKPGTLT
jgi:hypothetical protein